ncbi:hypothetical protein PHISP_04413 [Aspergillus sp. HF37]|nr:hypothetical protein PHISP_04413 [Aspergillus sp. HF37]
MSLQGLGIAGATVRETPTTQPNDGKKRPQSAPSIPGESSIRSSPELSITIAPAPDFDPSIGAKPYSPFYRHATPSLSLEHLTKKTRNASRSPTRMADTEAQVETPQSAPSGDQNSSLSKLWHRKKQPWELLEGLSKRHRIVVKVLIAVATVGTMIGIALGITSAVGGGVWVV